MILNLEIFTFIGFVVLINLPILTSIVVFYTVFLLWKNFHHIAWYIRRHFALLILTPFRYHYRN